LEPFFYRLIVVVFFLFSAKHQRGGEDGKGERGEDRKERGLTKGTGESEKTKTWDVGPNGK